MEIRLKLQIRGREGPGADGDMSNWDGQVSRYARPLQQSGATVRVGFTETPACGQYAAIDGDLPEQLASRPEGCFAKDRRAVEIATLVTNRC